MVWSVNVLDCVCGGGRICLCACFSVCVNGGGGGGDGTCVHVVCVRAYGCEY